MLHTKAIFFLWHAGTESSGLRNAIYRHTFETDVFVFGSSFPEDKCEIKYPHWIGSFLFCCCCFEVYLCLKEGILMALASLVFVEFHYT